MTSEQVTIKGKTWTIESVEKLGPLSKVESGCEEFVLLRSSAGRTVRYAYRTADGQIQLPLFNFR